MARRVATLVGRGEEAHRSGNVQGEEGSSCLAEFLRTRAQLLVSKDDLGLVQDGFSVGSKGDRQWLPGCQNEGVAAWRPRVWKAGNGLKGGRRRRAEQQTARGGASRGWTHGSRALPWRREGAERDVREQEREEKIPKIFLKFSTRPSGFP